MQQKKVVRVNVDWIVHFKVNFSEWLMDRRTKQTTKLWMNTRAMQTLYVCMYMFSLFHSSGQIITTPLVTSIIDGLLSTLVLSKTHSMAAFSAVFTPLLRAIVHSDEFQTGERTMQSTVYIQNKFFFSFLFIRQFSHIDNGLRIKCIQCTLYDVQSTCYV